MSTAAQMTGNFVREQCPFATYSTYVFSDLNLSNHFGATIAGPYRSHFPIRMLILSYQYLCLITSTSFCMSYIRSKREVRCCIVFASIHVVALWCDQWFSCNYNLHICRLHVGMGDTRRLWSQYSLWLAFVRVSCQISLNWSTYVVTCTIHLKCYHNQKGLGVQ